MIEYERARELVLAEAAGCGTEALPVARAGGRVLAEEIRARISSPPFDKAAMDGYAVRSEDLAGLPAELEVVGEVPAGRFPQFIVGPGQAAGITTGSPVPAGADTVIMVEHTGGLDGGRVRVNRLSGDNICAEGEDVRRGQTVLEAGAVLTPLRVGAAAAAGHPEVRVFRRPSGALLCTGSEVVEPGGEPARAQIFNANGPMLSALMDPLCRELAYLGIAGDKEGRLAALVQRGLEADVLVITGGVSVGPYDLVPRVLEEAGVRTVFHKVAIKPGKPTFFGRTEGTLVFGMPGNPQSCFVLFKMLVEPALAALGGMLDLPPHFEEGLAAETFRNNPERMNVMPCAIERGGGAPVIRRVPYHGSADIIGPGGADGFFLVPRGTECVNEGDRLRFFEI